MKSFKQAEAALQVLKGFGARAYKTPDDPTITSGKKIGIALARLGTAPGEILEAAGEGLEDLNRHLDAAVVRAMMNGRYKVQGRIVTIELGKEWE